MKRLLVIATFIVCFAVASQSVFSQVYPPQEEVEKAIEAGKLLGHSKAVLHNRFKIYDKLNAEFQYGVVNSDFRFYFLGPIQTLTKEVALAQRRALKKFTDFELSEDDIKKYSRNVAAVEVWAPYPQMSGGYILYQRHALGIVIVVDNDLDNPIRPIDTVVIPHMYINAFGFEVTSSSVIGYFEWNTFPHREDYFTVYVIGEDDTYDYGIKKRGLNMR